MDQDNLLNGVEQLEDLLLKIEKQEIDCLTRVLTRYCLLKGLPINIDMVSRESFEDRPNYWKYYVRFGRKDQGFLMSRELIIEDGHPKLNIIFNQELLNEDAEHPVIYK